MPSLYQVSPIDGGDDYYDDAVRITRESAGITMQDRPGATWGLGLFLLAGAALAILMPLGLATNARILPAWQRLMSVAIGVLGGGGTMWWLAMNPSTRVEIDAAGRQMRLRLLGLSGRRTRTVSFSELEYVGVQGGQDSDGGAVWRPLIRLRGGEIVLLSRLWSHDRSGAEKVAAAVADECGLRRP
jgi:hypothetical protein